MGRAAAFECHVDVTQAKAGGSIAGESVGAAKTAAPEVNEGGEAKTAFGVGDLARRRVIAAIELAGQNFGKVGPD